MTQHTPGPWGYRTQEFDDWGYVRGPVNEKGERWIVATARSGCSMTEEEFDAHRRAKTDPFEANARLIAAAPDMLAALQAVAAVSQSGADTVSLLVELNKVALQACAAIRKATGGQ